MKYFLYLNKVTSGVYFLYSYFFSILTTSGLPINNNYIYFYCYKTLFFHTLKISEIEIYFLPLSSRRIYLTFMHFINSLKCDFKRPHFKYLNCEKIKWCENFCINFNWGIFLDFLRVDKIIVYLTFNSVSD